MHKLIPVEKFKSEYFDVCDIEVEKSLKYRIIKFKEQYVNSLQDTYLPNYEWTLTMNKNLEYFSDTPFKVDGVEDKVVEVIKYNVIAKENDNEVQEDFYATDEFTIDLLRAIDIIFENKRMNLGWILNYYIKMFDGKELIKEYYFFKFGEIIFLSKFKNDKIKINKLIENFNKKLGFDFYDNNGGANFKIKVKNNTDRNFKIKYDTFSEHKETDFLVCINLNISKVGYLLSKFSEDLIPFLESKDNIDKIKGIIIYAKFMENKLLNSLLSVDIENSIVDFFSSNDLPLISSNSNNIFNLVFEIDANKQSNIQLESLIF
ncbi:hypothetical protein [Spiroplasma endosymbiont of Cantharis nigra]|uniref:hypothetical protein n=1 Tax=Spiroplasma endosymbiont of Cantharis nigra TaxID=3066278 RepID=UPI0030CDFDF2